VELSGDKLHTYRPTKPVFSTNVEWLKMPLTWIEDRTLYVSVVFTFDIPSVLKKIRQGSLLWDEVVVGGIAPKLMPDMFINAGCKIEDSTDRNVLENYNPSATFTSRGCINRCKFCAVPLIEGNFRELDEWEDKPIICDNNLLACSAVHLDKVFDRLEKHDWCDFNQGLDVRLLNDYHAERIGRLKNPTVRLACDSMLVYDEFDRAVRLLRAFGTPTANIRSLVLVGYNTGVEEAVSRCKFVESYGIRPSPMWFTRLDSMDRNTVTDSQKDYGWTHELRVALFRYYYKGFQSSLLSKYMDKYK